MGPQVLTLGMRCLWSKDATSSLERTSTVPTPTPLWLLLPQRDLPCSGAVRPAKTSILLLSCSGSIPQPRNRCGPSWRPIGLTGLPQPGITRQTCTGLYPPLDADVLGLTADDARGRMAQGTCSFPTDGETTHEDRQGRQHCRRHHIRLGRARRYSTSPRQSFCCLGADGDSRRMGPGSSAGACDSHQGCCGRPQLRRPRHRTGQHCSRGAPAVSQASNVSYRSAPGDPASQRRARTFTTRPNLPLWSARSPAT